MYKNILFLTSILLFCSSIFGSDKRSISPNTQKNLNQELQSSILNQNYPDFLKALQDGAHVNTIFAKDMTALHFAAARSGLLSYRDDMIKNLLKHKAETNIRNTDHQTPLYMYTCRNPNPNIVALLLDAKADPEIVDVEKDGPLTFVKDRPILEVFLQKGFYPQNSLSLAKELIQPPLLPFIPVAPLTHIIISYLVEQDDK